jgi:hypothetical protein
MENLGEDLKEVVSEGGGIKKVIIGIISTIAISAMGLVGKIINDKFLGGGDNTEIAAPSHQQNVNVSGPEIIINIPEQRQTETRVVERVVEKPAPLKPKEKEDIEW